MKESNRRSFLKTSALGTIAGTALLNSVDSAEAQPFKGKLKKSLYYGMIGTDVSIEDKFQIVQGAGFAGIEIPTVEDSGKLDEFKAAAFGTNVSIHSIMNSRHWKYPLSSSDPKAVKTGMEGMEISLRNAKALGAETVLLVPAVVNAETSYKDAYTRSQKYVRELLPLAKELDIIIAVENVWNKFLLSPLEFARYVDELDSPYLKAYFDVGNIALYGYPHDWIRTLGERIVKVHIKGFDVKKKEFTNLIDGTIDWLEVRRAFSDIGYSGYIGAELKSGDESYLADVSKRMDRIIAGKT